MYMIHPSFTITSRINTTPFGTIHEMPEGANLVSDDPERSHRERVVGPMGIEPLRW